MNKYLNYIFIKQVIILLGLYFIFSRFVLKENFISANRYFKSRCNNLNFKKCLQTSSCGWLNDENPRCLTGTPIGPLNPKLQPDSDNDSNNRWIFNYPNPFIFC